MGRIVARVKVSSVLDPAQSIDLDALVDTGASHLALPLAWRERLSTVPEMQLVVMETPDQREITGHVCGPVRIEIEGFRAVHGDLAFVPMQPAGGQYEPLLGYLPLEQAGIAVDMLGHRLVPVRKMDLK